jgi:hypothetical protein
MILTLAATITSNSPFWYPWAIGSWEMSRVLKETLGEENLPLAFKKKL